jgi:cytidylate kinase
MAATVICISRTDGANGEAVGVAVAGELGYRYIDREVVARAAEKGHVDQTTIEGVETRKSFVRRLLEGLVHSGPLLARGDPASGMIEDQPSSDTFDLRDVIRSVIADLAEEGHVVIVSHAASMALAGNPNVLRVLVTASANVRADRVSRGGKWFTPEGSALAIRDADRSRQDYFRRFYGVSEEPTHYDLLLNTDQLSASQAAAIVCGAARIVNA